MSFTEYLAAAIKASTAFEVIGWCGGGLRREREGSNKKEREREILNIIIRVIYML